MLSPYDRFRAERAKLKEENKEKYAERTLKYFEALTEAVTRIEYERNWDYLQSVSDYIEKEEYITPNQIDIVDRILNHPDEIPPEGMPF